MTVSPRGGSWEVYVKVGGDIPQRYRLTASTEAQGKAWEKAIREQLDAGWLVNLDEIRKIQAEGERTVRQVADMVIARQYAGKKVEEASTKRMNIVVGILGNMPVAALTEDHVDMVVSALQVRGNAPATVNRTLSALSCVATLALRRGWLAKKLHIERLQEPKGRGKFFSAAEEEDIRQASREVGMMEFGNLFMFLADTGARVSEALGLERAHITDTTVTFWKTKNDDPRTVPLTARARATLRIMDGDRPFPWSYRQVNYAWEVIRARLGKTEDPEWVIHTLRHTCASRLAQRGAQLQVIKAWMGHRDIQMTMRYAHLCPSTLAGAVSLLEPTV